MKALRTLARLFLAAALAAPAFLPAQSAEKVHLKVGIIPVPEHSKLVIARDKGFFAEEGLNVTLEPQANWKVLLDGVIGGQLDGTHPVSPALSGE